MNFYKQIAQERKLILDKLYEIELTRSSYLLYNIELGTFERIYRKDETIESMISFLQGKLDDLRDRIIEFEMFNRRFYGNNS